MDFKKTLILSVLFHHCFFAVALLSADLSKGIGKTHEEKVFFVRLSEEEKRKGKVSSLSEKVSSHQTPSLIAGRSLSQDVLPVAEKSLCQPAPSLAGESPYYHPSPFAGELPFQLPSPRLGEGKGEGLNTQEESTDNTVLVNYKPPPSGNVGVSADKGSETLPSDIIDIIRNSIEKVKTYPLLARERGIEGTVYISFRINSQGEPVEIKVLKSSGSWILDMATLNVIKKAASFPYTEERIEVPVIYKLMN